MAGRISSLALSLALLVAATLAHGQEYRASLLGVISDPTGAAVPSARVIVTNTETGVVSTTQANDQGNYLFSFVLPGAYRLRVEQAGFKTFERSPIELRMNDRVRIDVGLEVGSMSERVTVTAEAPLLETASADGGQVISQINELPANFNNPILLLSYAAGVQFNGNPIYFRPFDQGSGGINAFSISGGPTNRNEIQMDGVPNTFGYDIAYVPSSEAVQQLKVQTNTYDAQFGRTGGGTLSMSTKSGTNTLHGAAFGYFRRTELRANTYQSNLAGAARTVSKTDQYGFQLGGPVLLPKLYRGRERTFFMFSFEHFADRNPYPGFATFPTVEQKRGDFSKTFTSSGQLYTIYDRLSMRANPAYTSSKPISLTNPRFLLDPFAGNQVPRERMNPVAVNVLKYIPDPNQPGNPLTGSNNYFFQNVAGENAFNNLLARIDHTLSEKWKMYGRWQYSKRIGQRRPGNYGVDTPIAGPTWADRINDGGVLDFVGTLTPRTVANLRVGIPHYSYRSAMAFFDQAELGFPKSMLGQLAWPYHFPGLTWENYSPTVHDGGPLKNPYYTYTVLGDLLRTQGKHSWKLGGEFRHMQQAQASVGHGQWGYYNFTRAWTRANPDVDDYATGNAIASCLLGYIASGSTIVEPDPFNSQRYAALYVHDSWQATRRLTLNAGLRWDYEGPPMERFNRLTRGFDFNARSPIQVPGYDLRGGLIYAGVGGQPRGAYDRDLNNFQPRFGLAYKPLKSRPLVFRGGFGRSFVPIFMQTGSPLGFSQTTSIETTTADLKPFNTLSSPFPNGVLQPPGASQGLASFVGTSVRVSNPHAMIPNVWQYSAGFQYELTPGLLIEASYVGSQAFQLQIMGKEMNYIPLDEFLKGTAYLSRAVPNPFFNVLPPTTSRGAQATVQIRNLLVPYPQFTSVLMDNISMGRSWYDSAQFKAERRFKSGFSLLATYTISKNLESMTYLNPQDAKPSHDLVSYDRPQRATFIGIFELPFGPKRKWINSGASSRIAGGWKVNWGLVAQSGTPITYPSGYELRGNPKLESGQSLGRWFDTSAAIWFKQLSDTLRTIPIRSPNIRSRYAPQLSLGIAREFRIREGQKLEFKAAAFNATNTPIFGAPNTTPTSPLFGVVTPSQINLPRDVQLGLRYAF